MEFETIHSAHTAYFISEARDSLTVITTLLLEAKRDHFNVTKGTKKDNIFLKFHKRDPVRKKGDSNGTNSSGMNKSVSYQMLGSTGGPFEYYSSSKYPID